MLKVFVFLLMLFCGAMLGSFFSAALSERCTALLSVENILRQAGIYIRYNRLELSEILQRLKAECEWLLTDRLAQSALTGSFAAEWERHISCADMLTDEDKAVLLPLGKELGKSDAQGQTAIIDSALIRLDSCIRSANDDKNRKGRLYRTLGILSGAAAGIILIPV